MILFVTVGNVIDRKAIEYKSSYLTVLEEKS
jgi:hypothetical protein